MLGLITRTAHIHTGRIRRHRRHRHPRAPRIIGVLGLITRTTHIHTRRRARDGRHLGTLRQVGERRVVVDHGVPAFEGERRSGEGGDQRECCENRGDPRVHLTVPFLLVRSRWRIRHFPRVSGWSKNGQSRAPADGTAGGGRADRHGTGAVLHRRTRGPVAASGGPGSFSRWRLRGLRRLCRTRSGPAGNPRRSGGRTPREEWPPPPPTR